MTIARIPWYGAALLLILVAGYCLALAGQALCSPSALPGESVWVWMQRLGDGVGIVFGQEQACFLGSAPGETSLALASWSGLAALAVIAVAALWETLGRRARLLLRRALGGHAVLVGEPGEIDALAASLPGTAAIYAARNRPAARDIARAHPMAEVALLGDRRNAATLVRRLGAPKAAFVAAATANDLANGEIAEAALAGGGEAEILLRLEQASVRALKSDLLRRAAERSARTLTVVSLRQMQARQALELAMPGRYVDKGASRVHIALCGSGPMMQDMAFLLARQGYGLEKSPPILSVLRTGRNDFAAGALERLDAAQAVELHAVEADGDDAVAIDRGFTAIALAETPLSAVHCCEDEDGGALALALRIERALVDLALPVPPIVVYGSGPDAPGDTGMIRVAQALDLGGARRSAALLDQRAVAFHESYLDGQRKARGDEFGGLPAEREWSQLPELFRDDNRAAADHIGYKLARAGLVARPGDTVVPLTESETAMLAQVEHARWMAGRSLAGWKFGKKRDEKLRLHPDLKPYDALSQDAQRKDREMAALVPAQLARAGETVARLRIYAILSGSGRTEGLERLSARWRDDPDVQPAVAVALEDRAAIEVAEAATDAKLPVEVYVATAPEQIFTDPQLRRRAAAILRRALTIHVVRGRTPTQALEAACPILVEADGRLHETVLA